MKQFFKSLFFFAHAPFSGLKNRASILMYHSVDNNSAFFTVRPDVFEKQMAYLARKSKNGTHQIIKLSALVQKMQRREDISRCVCITFDDGYHDNYTQAFPILKTHNIPCTIFVPTDHIGKQLTNSEGVTLPLVDENLMRDMFASGLVEFMPHGKTHRTFDTLSSSETEREIADSRKAVELITGQPADMFAFPKGVVTIEALEALKKSLYQGVVTVREGTVSQGDDLFQLKRNSIDSSTSFWQFSGKMSTAIDRYCELKEFFTHGNSRISRKS